MSSVEFVAVDVVVEGRGNSIDLTGRKVGTFFLSCSFSLSLDSVVSLVSLTLCSSDSVVLSVSEFSDKQVPGTGRILIVLADEGCFEWEKGDIVLADDVESVLV